MKAAEKDLGVALIQFMKTAQERCDADYSAFAIGSSAEHIEANKPRLECMGGPRYIKIVSVSGTSRSAWCFVDKTTGDVLKAAGWKTPAKNFARGNIYNADHGCARVRWTGVS